MPALGILTAGSLIGSGLAAHHKRRMAELEIEREKLGLRKRGRKLDDADIPDEYFGLPKSRRKKDHLYKPKSKR